MQVWKDYVDNNRQRFLDELFELLKIQSISSSSANKKDMDSCAQFLKEALLKAGADKATVYPTKGNSIVYAEKMVDPSKPTVLAYGHYDVQPVEPLELWISDPFSPEIRDGKIFGRGTADDKGQLFMHIKALEILSRTSSFPLNLKFIFEGEEEIGSTNLGPFIKEHKDLLKADVVLISDTAMFSIDHPSMDTGVRGLSYIEVEVTGPNRDLHSGVYGGAVANPAIVLSQMIASCFDNDNHITIPGFYDGVDDVSAEERKKLAESPFKEDVYKEDLGIKEVFGEKGFSTNERTGIRPCLDVNGIWGGFTGEGSKTVLPSKASAKISARIVPHQNSEHMTEILVNYFKKIAPDTVTVKVTPHHGGEPYVTPIDSLEYKAAAQAMTTILGKEPFPVRGGGSIPICTEFERNLDARVVFMGFGLDSDNIHSPNEKYDLINFFKGIETIPYFHKYYAELKAAKK